MLPAMLAAAWLSGLAAVQPYAQITETTASPLRKIIDCRGAGSGAAACGPAVPIRTTWTNFCGLEAIQNKTRLAGIVLDVVLIPSEDETLFLLDAAGKTYLGGIVGEVLTQIATEGMFEFNAIVVDPPTFDEYHDGKIHEDDGDEDEYHDWTAWAMDWTNRAGITYMALLTTYNGTTRYLLWQTWSPLGSTTIEIDAQRGWPTRLTFTSYRRCLSYTSRRGNRPPT